MVEIKLTENGVVCRARTAYSSVSSLSLNDEKWQFPLHLLPTRFTIFSLCYIHRLWLANFRQATEYLLDSGLLLTMQLPSMELQR